MAVQSLPLIELILHRLAVGKRAVDFFYLGGLLLKAKVADILALDFVDVEA